MKTYFSMGFWIFISVMLCSCSRTIKPKITDIKLTDRFTVGDQHWTSVSDSMCILVVGLTIKPKQSFDRIKAEETYIKDDISEYHEFFRMTIDTGKKYAFLLFNVPKEIKHPDLILNGHQKIRLKTGKKIVKEMNVGDLIK